MTYLADLIMWAWCWIAYRLVIVLPSHRGGLIYRVWFWLLPFAGFYAYREKWMPWRWSRAER